MTTGEREPQAFEAVVLAAGAGSRFGGGKLLAPFGDGVLLDGALAAAFAAPVSRVLLVTGADAGRVVAAAQAFAAGRGEAGRLWLVHAPAHGDGMGASLAAAARALSDAAAGAFIFLGDMPRVPPGIAERLARAVLAGAPAAAPAFGGHRGHPVLVGQGLFARLRQAAGDEGLRGALAELGERLALIEAPDDGVLFDVDTPDDLRRGRTP